MFRAIAYRGLEASEVYFDGSGRELDVTMRFSGMRAKSEGIVMSVHLSNQMPPR